MDPLDRFSAALAAEHDGEVAAPGVTRTRILERLVKRRSPRSTLRVVWMIPLFMLGAGSALAASGRLPSVLAPVARWLDSNPVASASGPVQKQKRSSLPAPPGPGATASAPGAEALRAAAAPVVAAPAVAVPAVTPQAPILAAAVPRSSTTSTPSSLASTAATDSTAPAPSSRTDLAHEPGLALYAAAHRAHFRSSDYDAAVRHYERYLESAPSGSFVTEARYNRSLCLLRLGRTAEARPILTEFAKGAYGSYRKVEATRLLDALPPVPPAKAR